MRCLARGRMGEAAVASDPGRGPRKEQRIPWGRLGSISGRPFRTVAWPLGLILWALAWFPGWGLAAQPDSSPPPPAGNLVLDFDGCVRSALTQSPQLSRSAMEVDLRRVDESDSKWSFIPNISLQTTVYLYGPTQQPDTRGYSIDFVTNQYNPLESYFSLRAKEILTNIARYSHMQAISVGIHRLAQTILDLDQREQLSARQEEMIGLARQKLDYVRRIQRMGSATLLDVKGVETQLQALQAEGEALNMARASALEELKLHLGFPAEQRLSIDFPQARRQLLAGFEPQNATLDQALERSFELKILRLREGVQDYQITQAYGKYMPTFFFGVRTPDPLNTTTKQEYFFFVGANLPVWDGMQRANNVTRQKIILRQYQLDTVAKRTDLASRWRVVQDQLRNALAAVKVAQSAEELAALHVEQREIRYKANGQPLSLLLDDKMARAEAQKRLISRRLEQDQAALNVRHTCGDLFTTFVNPLPSQD